MRYVTILWDAEDDEHGNVCPIAEHGLTADDVEFVIEHATAESRSNSSGRPCVFGHTPSGEYCIVVFEEIDEDTIYPVTAYEVQEAE